MIQKIAKRLLVFKSRLTSTDCSYCADMFPVLNVYSKINTVATSATIIGEKYWHGTTIVCVRKNGKVCMIGDGQVSKGDMIVKPNAHKIRLIYPKTNSNKLMTGDGGTLVGFAGSTSDAFTLFERLESKLDEYPGQLIRSCVELTKAWRTDKYLRRLDAVLIVADKAVSLQVTGYGDVLESHDKILAVGSGSVYAVAAARALQDVSELSADDVATKAINIASDMCVYTNTKYVKEIIDIERNEET